MMTHDHDNYDGEGDWDCDDADDEFFPRAIGSKS